MPQIIGLTGGIGSGKSTVSKLWARKGVVIIDADSIARSAVARGRPSHLLIRLVFGKDVFNVDGTVDRVALSGLVFADYKARRLLNLVTHPFIIAEMLVRCVWNIVFRWEPLVVLDTPLLFESGKFFRILCTSIVVVYCTESQQVQRIVDRDGMTETEARQRVRSQMSLDEKKHLANFVIDNTGDTQETEQNALSLLKKLEPSPAKEWFFRSMVLICSIALCSTVL